MSTATLGFAIDSSQAAGAAADLDKLTSSAAKAEQAATKVSGAGTRMSRGFADLNPALDKIIGSLGRLEGIATSIDKRLDAMASAAGRAAKANTVLDQSAVEASTAYKQLEASLNAVTAAQKKADAAQSSSLAMIQKQKAAIASLNAELAKLRNTPMPSQPGNPANNNVPAGGQAGVGNIAAQFFDIGTTAAFMNPATVAIQQGPQLAQAFAGQSTKQALTSLAGGLAAIVSPLSLVAIGLTGAAAAAIQYGVGLATASTETKKLDDILQTHDALLKRIDERYGSLTEKARGFASETANVLGFQSASDVRALRGATNRAQYDVFDQTGSILSRNRGGTAGGNDLSVDSAYEPIEAALRRLRGEAKAGKPDFDAFYDSLYQAAALDPKFAKKADELALLVEQYRQGTKALQEMERVQRAIFNDRGPNGMLLSQGPTNQADMSNLALYESQQRVATQRRQQGFDAQVAGVNARSPQERAAAARAAAAAQYNNDETAAARRTRIEQAGSLVLIQAERQLAEAQRERAANLDKIVQDQQNEIDLVGKTGGAAAALRKEYELTSTLRMEAARQGIEVDQRELDLIKERAAALGQLTDQYNQSRFNFEMGQQTSDALMSPRDRQISTTLRQYGLPEDLGGANAQRVGQQYDWQQAKDMAKGFGSAFSSELVTGSHDIGKSFLKGFQSAVENQATKLWEKFFDSAGNMFASWLTGTPGTGSTGAIGSAAAALGGRVANDNTAGAFSGLAKVGAVTRSSLPDVTATGDIASYIRDAAVKRGIDPNTALRVAKSEGGLDSWNLQSNYVKNGVREQSYGPFQLYKGGGLGNAFQAKTGLDPALAANGPAATDFALDHASKNGWGAWYGAAKVGVGKWDGIGAGGAATGADAVNKLAEAAGSATKGLDTFGGGIGKLGQSLSAFPAAPAAPGGGGGAFSWLGGLFGGGLSKAQIAKYTPMTGLFADGTNYAPGGMAIVGEKGPELVNLPQGSQVFDTNRSARMMGGNGASTGEGQRKYNINVYGGSGDDHIRGLVRQGIASADSDRETANRRGGTGEANRRYSNQKG